MQYEHGNTAPEGSLVLKTRFGDACRVAYSGRRVQCTLNQLMILYGDHRGSHCNQALLISSSCLASWYNAQHVPQGFIKRPSH